MNAPAPTSAPSPRDFGLRETEGNPVLRPGLDGGVAVIEALAKVMGELPNIGKDDQAPAGEGRYRYRGIEAITRHVQGLLSKHGVVIIPRAEVLATVPSVAMNEGWQDVLMRVEWSLFGLDGSSLTAVTNGVGRDKSDKGANKAQTQAYKYLLLHTLCVADGKDDADGHSYEDDRSGQPQPVGRITTPDGQTIDLWPGELVAKEAKARVAEACAGDRETAAAAWAKAGLEGKVKVTEAEVSTAIKLAAQWELFGPDDAPPATEVLDTIDARAFSTRAASVFEAAIDPDAIPQGKKTWLLKALRHALLYAVTDGGVSSGKDADGQSLFDAWSALDRIATGSTTFEFSVDPAKGVTFHQAGKAEPTTVLWSELTMAEAEAEADRRGAA